MSLGVELLLVIRLTIVNGLVRRVHILRTSCRGLIFREEILCISPTFNISK